MSGPNAAQAERWGGPAGHHWVEHEAAYDRQLEGYGAALLNTAALQGSKEVLDVGCGTGTTSLVAARQAQHVLGLDLSPVLIDRARARAAAYPNLDFRVDDAQTARLAVPVDVVISRFGLMVFDDPPAAFSNLRRAAVPGGRLVTISWQGLERNDWMRVLGEALARVVPVGDLAEPGLPGPFSLASREDLTALLETAGWSDVTVDEVALPVPVGGARTLDDAVEFVRGGSLGRSVLAGVSPAVEARAMGQVRDALAPHVGPDGVVLPGAAWVVQATNVRDTPRR